jgi:flagellar basal-body rod protein FlgB
MIRTMFSKGSIPVLEKAISFHARRHPVIASNIANVNTPYYQAQDLPVAEFYEQLEKAIDERRGGNPRFFSFRPSRNIMLDARGNPHFNELYSGGANMLRHDGNNVDIDMEMAKLAKNTIMHNALVELLNHKFRGIQSAIRGRIS